MEEHIFVTLMSFLRDMIFGTSFVSVRLLNGHLYKGIIRIKRNRLFFISERQTIRIK